MVYFFDTYALIEIINGNKNYEKYKDQIIYTSLLNIAELWQALLRDFNELTAGKLYSRIKPGLLNLDEELVIKAVLFRFYNKKNYSLPDCIGYLLAKKYNIKFLTGDKEFEVLDNVEFVKK
ncbi:MAG: PIN domain-containing protein [Nanoarchaeota archaeon]